MHSRRNFSSCIRLIPLIPFLYVLPSDYIHGTASLFIVWFQCASLYLIRELIKRLTFSMQCERSSDVPLNDEAARRQFRWWGCAAPPPRPPSDCAQPRDFQGCLYRCRLSRLSPDRHNVACVMLQQYAKQICIFSTARPRHHSDPGSASWSPSGGDLRGVSKPYSEDWSAR
jgi:hypothetical protein